MKKVYRPFLGLSKRKMDPKKINGHKRIGSKERIFSSENHLGYFSRYAALTYGNALSKMLGLILFLLDWVISVNKQSG